MLAEEGITFERLSVLPDCIRICGAGAVEHMKAYKEGQYTRSGSFEPALLCGS